MLNMILMPKWGVWIIVLSIFVLIVVGLCIIAPINVWFKMLMSGAHVSMIELSKMRSSKLPVKDLLDIYLSAKKAKLTVSIGSIENHYMAKGNIKNVIDALIVAEGAKLKVDYKELRSLDLAGKDVLDIVNSAVSPKLICTDYVDAVAGDGIQLRARFDITAKAILTSQVGMAGADTIISRVKELAVLAIGSAGNHNDILSNPNSLLCGVDYSKLSNGTSYEVISISVVGVEVGENVGARLKLEEAEKKKKIAMGETELKRAQAQTREQEMKAKTQEMKAIALATEKQINDEILIAIKNGKLDIVDYYKIQNLQADTNMRKSLMDNKPDNKFNIPKV